MTSFAIRPGVPADAEELAGLFDQLGHPQPAATIAGRLEQLADDPRALVLVAELAGQLVGAATCYLVPVVHDDRPWCRIAALVVDGSHRGRGIGGALVEAAEVAARAAGCSRIEATSALHREQAHRFYERLGFGRSSAHLLKRL